nr:hypothetical protein [Tanacetum cinerariifolium]
MVINSPCLNDKKELAIPEQMATGKESTNPLMADSLPKTIMPTKLVKPQGFNLSPNIVVCSGIANYFLSFRHGEMITIFGAVVKLALSELSAYGHPVQGSVML